MEYNSWLESYYETLMSVDESVGRIRHYLKAQGLDKTPSLW